MSQFNQPIGSRSQQSHVKPHRGTLVLVLGIISLIPALNICGVLGIMAWIFGSSDLKEMKAGIMDRQGEGATRAGYICGIISTCLTALGIEFSLEGDYRRRWYDKRPNDGSGSLKYHKARGKIGARRQLSDTIAAFATYDVLWRSTNRHEGINFRSYLIHQASIGLSCAL